MNSLIQFLLECIPESARMRVAQAITNQDLAGRCWVDCAGRPCLLVAIACAVFNEPVHNDFWGRLTDHKAEELLARMLSVTP